MLAACMARDKGMRSYPDIGGAAFGGGGRVLVSVLLYLELFCCCVDFLILEGDGLGELFPHATLAVGGLRLTAKQVCVQVRATRHGHPGAFGRRVAGLHDAPVSCMRRHRSHVRGPGGHAAASPRVPSAPCALLALPQTCMLIAAAVLLPTVLMRDLSLLSYLSVFGIFAVRVAPSCACALVPWFTWPLKGGGCTPLPVCAGLRYRCQRSPAPCLGPCVVQRNARGPQAITGNPKTVPDPPSSRCC
jgi:hypothetical protein